MEIIKPAVLLFASLIAYSGASLEEPNALNLANGLNLNSGKLDIHSRQTMDDMEHCELLYSYDTTIVMRLCVMHIRYAVVNVYDATDNFVGMWIFYFDPTGSFCKDIAIRTFVRGRNYTVKILCYDIDGVIMEEEEKLIQTKDQYYPTSMVFGEPHFLTYDGHRYSYQGVVGCWITLSRHCVANNPHFVIEGLLEKSPLSTPDILYTRVGIVSVYAHSTNVTMEHNRDVYVNGLLVKDFPHQAHENITILDTSLATNDLENELLPCLHTVVDGVGVIGFSGKYRTTIMLTDTVWLGDDVVCGMHGTPNNPVNIANDFLRPDMTTMTVSKQNVDAFGNSWLRCP
ncbi:alpha-tectorin-like [Ptychodera flava]|uniref:alpha-tectorin-like n=1 Tax=Ptychodera flava TaxID=63121 RepID=UPI003969E41D